MAFLYSWFALAGLVAAAGPVIIHLLNRQRYRTVEWAAMDFLREALRRSRRVLHLRDALLMALRMACLLLFGLAMARPYLTGGAAVTDPDQPVHGIVLLDNGLSASYQEIDGTVLDAAKQKAKQWIEKLPRGSRVTLLPLCGSAAGMNLAPYPSRGDAVDALGRVEWVDRATSPSAALDLACEAAVRAPDLPVKRVVLVADQRMLADPPQMVKAQLERLAVPVETIPLGAHNPENAWISSFKLQDDVADLQTPSIFLATVRYQGNAPRNGVEVKLSINGQVVRTVLVDLIPNQSREIRFAPYQFDVQTEPGRPAFAMAEVSITPDRLKADDQRFLVVPVVSALPVVFVDQYGDSEDAQRGRFGETLALRRLLAPVNARDGSHRQLIQVRRATIDRVDRDLLQDARLVVIAGVPTPGRAVHVLREYVAQGGQVVIAAGGDFDPAAWTQAAWLGGLGVLPAPLKPAFVGRLLEKEGEPPKPLQLEFNSLVHDYFQLEQTSREELQDLYRLPFFFKAADTDLDKATIDPMIQKMAEQIESDRQRLVEIDRQIGAASGRAGKGGAVLAGGSERAALEQERLALRPSWLLWTSPQAAEDLSKQSPADAAEATRPRCLATLTGGTPYLVGRRIGLGQVLFVSSGFSIRWNTLAVTNTMLLFDRVLRAMLAETFPKRNATTDQHWIEPVAAAERQGHFALTGPDGFEMPLSVDAIGFDRYGIGVPAMVRRGHYKVTAWANGDAGHAGSETKLWEFPVAVNGPTEPSQLRAAETSEGDRHIFQPEAGRKMSQSPAGAVVAVSESGSTFWTVAGRAEVNAVSQLGSQYLWKLGMWAALVCLLAELAVLTWSMLRSAQPNGAPQAPEGDRHIFQPRPEFAESSQPEVGQGRKMSQSPAGKESSL